MTGMVRRLARLLLWVASLAPAAAWATPAPWPPVLGDTLVQALDDPQSALEAERRLAASAEGETRFWRLLSVARLESLLERDNDVAVTLDRAAAALAALPSPPIAGAPWLRAAELRQRSVVAGSPAQLAVLAEMHAGLPAGPSVLRCELLDIETWLLGSLGSLDEAWRTAEALDRCGLQTGWGQYRVQAALTQGQIAAADDGGPETRDRVVAHFARADAAVAPGPGRFVHSLIAYAAGKSLAGLNRPRESLVQMQRALAISRSLGDLAGIAAAQLEIAGLDLDLGRPADALAPLDEASQRLRELGDGAATRSVRLLTLRLRAQTALGGNDLRQLLARGQTLDLVDELPGVRRALMLAVAEGQATLGRFDAAYEAMRRARELDEQARKVGRDAQVLKLQMRYETAQRDAEIAELRHREESARLTVAAQAAVQRGLWTALAALVLGLAAALVLGWRSWQRRRELADLALRDDLTGLPNRRAIEAYARAQLQQSRRLGLPFALALLDLDHFKQVNDQHGHAVGDALLKALARAVPTVLRAPDRLGRWGGEEFLLVLPGTRADEFGGVYARLLAAFAAADVPELPDLHGVTFSLGGAQAAADTDFDALLAEADRRLYAAKSAGRATWR